MSVTTDIEGHVARITLNNPDKRNAFDDIIIASLTEAFEKVGGDDSVRVVVLQAAGKHFSAGADLNWMRAMGKLDAQQNQQAALRLAGAAGEVVLASVIVVPHAQPLDAVLDGAAAGAGAVLDAGERAARGAAAFDTRLLRARSFAEGVLTALARERFDMLVLKISREPNDGMRTQVEALLERATPPVVLVRAAAAPATA